MTRCTNELLTLEYGECRNVKRLQAAHVIFTALEFSSDSVEIMNEQFKLLYVNNSFEKLTGQNFNDLFGQDFASIHLNNDQEQLIANKAQMLHGHVLDCELNFKKSNGVVVEKLKSSIIPVKFQGETK